MNKTLTTTFEILKGAGTNQHFFQIEGEPTVLGLVHINIRLNNGISEEKKEFYEKIREALKTAKAENSQPWEQRGTYDI